MHAEARRFVERQVRGRRFKRVLEFGSLDINGSVRDLVEADLYHGIDLVAGKGVDEVADATSYRSEEPYDLVICCEVLEHLKDKAGILHSAATCLRKRGCCEKPGGELVITCATWGREPHSAVDGGALREGEWYENVNPAMLKLGLTYQGFEPQEMKVDFDRGDFYVSAVRV